MKTRFATLTSCHKRTIPRKRLLLFSLPLLMAFLTACPTSTPTPPKPTITSFTASPASLPAGGGSITLIWDVKNATTLSIDSDVGEVTGTSKTVSVTNSKIFTLTATNAEGSATKSVGVSVAPTVVSINPANGAVGVKDDASITVTFSEKMNQEATTAAYTSADLPASEVTFSWNTESTALTIKPKNVLEYATGNDPIIAAKTYTVSLSNRAKDLAGNSLAPFSSVFSTLKRINPIIYGITNMDGEVIGNLSGGVNTTSEVIRVGDLGDSVARGFFSFDLRVIPDNSDIHIEKATLNIYKVGLIGNPYQFSLLSLDAVLFGELEENTYNGAVLYNIGIFDSAANPSSGYLSSDVTEAATYGWNNSTRWRNEYRLSFPTTNTEKGFGNYISFTSTEGPADQRPFLQVTYVTP
jgi:hypothetical protein